MPNDHFGPHGHLGVNILVSKNRKKKKTIKQTILRCILLQIAHLEVS